MLTQLKQLTLSICIVGFSAASWAQTVLVKSEHQVEEYTLDNGLKIILAPNDKENKVFMNTIYFTGSLNDPEGKGGLAHLLEHLAFKGTQNIKEEEFQRRLDQYTLMTNASTDYYSTKYTNIIRPDQQAIDQILELEAERMDKLVLQEKYVPAEIAIVMREREIRMDQPFAVLLDKMWKAAYGNQSLGRLPIGDLNELQSIKMAELNQFYRHWYAPNNATMVITGKFDRDAVLKSIDQKFSPIAARSLPAQSKVPALDSAKIQPREFLVQKGSDLAKFNIYLNGKNEKIKTTLALAPFLYTLQPSGHLYSSMVETGTSTMVQSSTWLERDFNVVFMGAIYAPNHDEKKVAKALVNGVEQTKDFNDVELKRVKTLVQNQADNVRNNAAAMGGRLSDYVVSYQGGWDQYFKDLDQVQALKTKDVNQVLKQFLVPAHRIGGDVKPTPEDQKKALEQKQGQVAKTLDQSQEKPEPFKDIKVYQKEVAEHVQASQQKLTAIESKIQQGQLENGMQYAFYPSATPDDKTYASIHIGFGKDTTLMNQAEIIELTAYLLLRASDRYSLQDIADQSLQAGGIAVAQADENGMTIQINAKKEKFEDFFNYIVQVMKNPKFEQTQFDLIKQQSLSLLNRPYTEPETVAALTMARLLERYQPGDLRYHFEPEFAKKQMQAASNEQVKALYKKFFGMEHAQIAVTGQFDTSKMKKILQQSFGDWRSGQEYQRLSAPYEMYTAQKVHALAEQREFGNYQALLALPVKFDHPDAAALHVFSYVLGNSQLSSRLAMELREKNALVYGFGSDLDLGQFEASGALSIQANYSAGKSAQVSSAVHKVLKQLIDRGITVQELEAAKANMMKKRVTALDDARSIHGMISTQLLTQTDMHTRQKRDQEIAKLTKADVDAAIKKYIQLDHLVETMADQYGQAQK
ncbi:M16 family metallopeptidase [Acinetobacter rudis]|uniref:Insulinase family protein n=1 Tax=Acinetobacter rudis TaxID=632955 RepID=A0AAW8J4Y5_9GAMM|nr:insulinase family protein [Acinetobacter rudis]MDQ8934408.1 insulinase family protein [Acinetobacter rudis]MDQ9016692.1 insulinase family protein [Acinetobacter rudis]